MKPLEESRRIVDDSRSADRAARPHSWNAASNRPTKVEYRSAGEYALDMWRAGLGNQRRPRTARDLQPRRRAPDHRRQPRPAPRADPRPGRQLHRHRPPARQRARARGSSRPGRGHGRRITQHTLVGPQSAEKAELAVPEDDDRQGPRHRRHLRRLRQRLPPEHRLVAAGDHGPGHQRPRRPVRDRDRRDRGPGVLHRRDRGADDPRHPGRRRRRRRAVGGRRAACSPPPRARAG